MCCVCVCVFVNMAINRALKEPITWTTVDWKKIEVFFLFVCFLSFFEVNMVQ